MPSPQRVGDGATEPVLQAVREQTHILLGRTISYSEEDWAQPSRLPGWTRSHVAAHLVANARELRAVCQALGERHGDVVDLGSVPAPARSHALELGSLADGLSLQIDLDTSAGELHDSLATLEPDRATVRLGSGAEVAAHQLPLVRLHEVCLHSLDLSPDVDELALDPAVADELLAFRVGRLGDDVPRLHILSHEGFEGRVGRDGEPVRVTGPAADLFIWLARDVITDRIGGAIPLRG